MGKLLVIFRIVVGVVLVFGNVIPTHQPGFYHNNILLT